MFTGLFVVVHAFEANVVRTWGVERVARPARRRRSYWCSGLPVLLSNLVSNVPAVLLFKPLMEVMPQKELAWLALAMSSTLAGNLTLLGSVANLIVVENARRAGRPGVPGIPKVGVPLTVVTTLVGHRLACVRCRTASRERRDLLRRRRPADCVLSRGRFFADPDGPRVNRDADAADGTWVGADPLPAT